MKQYLDLLSHIMETGADKGDRTGTGTRSVFGYQMRFDLSEGFPLLTTKKLPFTMIANELLWFLDGSTNIRPLLANNIHIWDDWPFKSYLTQNNLPVPAPNTPEWEQVIKEFTDKVLAPYIIMLYTPMQHTALTWRQEQCHTMPWKIYRPVQKYVSTMPVNKEESLKNGLRPGILILKKVKIIMV